MYRFRIGVCCLCLASFSIAAFAQDKDKDQDNKEEKPYDNGEASLAEMIGETRDYKPGDLITWEDVKPYVEQLKENGVEIPDEKDLTEKFLSNGDRVVKMMRTQKGTVFMRNMTKAGGKYDILDRFRKLPRGYTMLQTMIDTPKGHQLLSDMSTTKVGMGTALQLEDTPLGKDFTKPTGLLYKEEDFFKYLEEFQKKSSSEESPDTPAP